MVLIDILNESIKKHPNKVALVMKMGYRTRTFTYAQIYELAYKTALFLKENGIQKNDKVIICAPNSPYWIILFWGCLLAGAVPVPLNIQTPSAQIQKIIDQTEAKILFKYLFFKNNLENIKEFNIEHLEDLIEKYNPKDLVPDKPSDEDLIQIMYTSGTTGNPKGVMLTNKNLCSNLSAVKKLINVDLEKDTILSILPLSHIFEQTMGFLLPYSEGVTIVYAHSHSAISDLLKQYNITKIAAVPEFLQIFMARVEGALEGSKLRFVFKPLMKVSDKINNQKISRFLFKPILKKMGNLDTIACGGAYLDPNLEKKWNRLGIRILQGYGLTETSPAVATNTFDDHEEGSVGKVLSNVQVKIGPDKEILIKGPNVFKGYYKEPEKTKEVFTEDGFFKSGDLGEFDKNGFLFIKGRKKYMILGPGGQNVYPEDIETELNKIPEVQDSCVVGIEKPNGAVEIHACLILKSDKENDIKKIIDEANKNLASYQQITGFSIWPEIDFPRTTTRKIKKNNVIEWINSRGNIEKQDDTQRKQKLILILSQITGVTANKINNKTKIVQDLHLDSLMRVELIIWIEQELNAFIAESDIKPETTVEDLNVTITSKKNQKIKTPKLKKWPRSFPAKILRSILQPIFILIAKIFVKLEVQGKENLNHLHLPVFFMPNHTSYLDGLVVEMAIPAKIRKKLSFAAARDVLYQKYWYISWLFELVFNSFAIQRGDEENIQSGLESIGQMLDKNYSVVLFPEGKMSKDGNLQEMKSGAGFLAVEMDVQVVPMLLIGARDIVPYDSTFPRKIRGKVIVKFGQPLTFKKTDTYEYANQAIFSALNELI